MDDLIDIEMDILQNEIEELENEIRVVTRKPYTIRNRLNPLEMYTDDEFRRRFRLSKSTALYLYDLIGLELEPIVPRPGFTISGLDKILITLRYFATANFHLASADFFGVSESSVCNIIPIVCDKIASLRERFIRMPITDAEIERNKRDFFRVAGMPAVIGAIDGTLVRIQEVGGLENKTLFYCRKQFYAMNVQIICDANAKVLDIVARWPGTIHDETIFLNSRIYERFLTGEFVRNGRISLLLGDGGYQAEPFLATPLRATNELNTRSKQLYQQAHISTRNVVERFMGQWKRRFPCLWVGTRFRKLETVQNTIIATAVLHNICKIRGDVQTPTLSRIEEIMYNAAVAREREFRNSHQSRQRLANTIHNQLLRNHFENIANERH